MSGIGSSHHGRGASILEDCRESFKVMITTNTLTFYDNLIYGHAALRQDVAHYENHGTSNVYLIIFIHCTSKIMKIC